MNNDKVKVRPVENEQQSKEKNPMNVDVQVILDDYRKQVSELEWSIKIKDAQIKNLQQALQEAKDKLAKQDKSTKATNK